MKICYIGKFTMLHDEEYLARTFESLGHHVKRIPLHTGWRDIQTVLMQEHPDVILFAKWEYPEELKPTLERLAREGMVTVCWLFDLYWGYVREPQIQTHKYFKADYVFTTDGGHDENWKAAGINHRTVRQGIYKEECFMYRGVPDYDVVFVGSDNLAFEERGQLVMSVQAQFERFRWFGRGNTNELRGKKLNDMFATTKVVIGDSYPSPHYWSNRVVETLGRGGFLIHKDTPGLKEEYPYIVTHTGKDDLFDKIKYYLKHDEEREELRVKNFEWVRDHYTADKKCQEILNYIT